MSCWCETRLGPQSLPSHCSPRVRRQQEPLFSSLWPDTAAKPICNVALDCAASVDASLDLHFT